MIAFISENAIHFYIGSLFVLFGGCLEMSRRLWRRERMLRGWK